eukprot:295769_1
MSDFSNDEDDESVEDSPQAFTQKFGAFTKQLPHAFKKAVSRERINTNNEQEFAHHIDKTSSFGSLFKTRFQQPFSNRIRSQSSLPQQQQQPHVNDSNNTNIEHKIKKTKTKTSKNRSSKKK